MTPRSRVAAVALTAALAAVAAEPPWVVVAGGRVAPPLVVQATAARDLRGLIAYGTQAGDIWVMDADGSHRRRLTRTGGRDYPGAWSPDGRRLAFGSERSGNFDVYVMDADGSFSASSPTPPTGRDRSPGCRTAASSTRASMATGQCPTGT